LAEDTTNVKAQRPRQARLDETDRTLLGLLAEDASRSYAELGRLMHLSAPAVHERAKRLRQEGIIRATTAQIDGVKVGRPFLAFVHVNTTSWAATRQLLQLKQFPEIEEIHSVTGDSAMLLKIRTRDTQGLEDVLGRIYALEGFTSTRSYVVLTTYLERGPSPESC
jgi:Lrp/AsnC family transcriptional regulator, leucine-responsive regulatory protein